MQRSAAARPSPEDPESRWGCTAVFRLIHMSVFRLGRRENGEKLNM